MSKTLIEAIEGIGLGKDIVQRLAVYQNAVSHPFGELSKEEVALCYTVGTLKFTEFKQGKEPAVRYGLLDMDLFNLDGVLNGPYQVVWQPQLHGEDLSNIPVENTPDPGERS